MAKDKIKMELMLGERKIVGIIDFSKNISVIFVYLFPVSYLFNFYPQLLSFIAN